MESLEMTRAKLEQFYRGRHVFVTGATGLLGSWLCRTLVDVGAEVVALVRDTVPMSNFHRMGLEEQCVVVRGAVENRDLMARTLNEYEIESVFHLAAQTIVGVANRGPISTFESNITGTWSLLEACRLDPRVRRVVVASSDKAYGVQEKLPYTEDAPLIGRYPYDVSKSCADLIAQSYFHAFGLPVCITRCGNLFGGGDLNFNRIVPDTIRSTLEGKPIVIRSDGTFVRDYIYVKDAALAYLETAMAMDREEIRGQAFNFSTETPMAVLPLVRLILRQMGREELEPTIANTAKSEIPNQYLDSSKARRMLDWHPHYTLESGLAETIAWYTEFLQGRR